jgi:hypothetical protein
VIFNFVADSVVRDRAYPSLAEWQAYPYTAEWRQFGQHYPYTIPMHLYEHCATHNVAYKIHTLNSDWPAGSYYGIALHFFHFDIDYLDLLPLTVKQNLQTKKLKLLFYYDEGDNPAGIKQRLDSLCIQHNLPVDCYHFISANTAAEQLDRFHYLPCDELLYWQRNQAIDPILMHTRPRSREFTALSRTHKWWRATVMADMYRNNILENSYWSYNTAINIGDTFEDNPLKVDILRIRNYVKKFLNDGPYACDMLTDDEHNDHSRTESAHYADSYCNIVLETHFDADQSGGTFLTEKTFKPIKHGQPFVIVGPAGSLARLRSLGYQTFDHAIDNSYDTITDNTARWQAVLKTIQQIKNQNMNKWFIDCWSDVSHNQQLFASSKADRLNTLLERLQ